MVTRVSAFLDTSALFAGIWSAEGGARMLLKLGETGAIRLLVSSHVLDEIERALRRKAPDTLGPARRQIPFRLRQPARLLGMRIDLATVWI